jgi:hypothetical protein
MVLDTKQSSSTVKREQLEVLSIAEGFFQSTVLSALLRLKVFERIGEETKSLEKSAAAVNTLPIRFRAC